MAKISRDEVLAHLSKSRAIRQIPIAPETSSQEGIPVSAVPGATPVRSVMLNPISRLQGFRGQTLIQPRKIVDYRVLRRVAEEAWLVNTLIIHLQNQVRPFLKRSTDENKRGFQIRLKDAEHTPTESTKKYMREIEDFFLKTGFGPDPERRDSMMHFSMKAVRDSLTLDQLATELQRTASGKVFAYWAVDPATITRVTEEGYDGYDAVRFIQEINAVPTAYYTDNDLIFDYGNPRSDIEYAGYGYSRVEAAIRLILAQINSFAYQSGALTEDSLPRGAILLNGDADMEDVEMIQDYLIDIMSGGPASKWKIPIIPGGAGADGKGNSLQWVNFRNTNREMEFVEWTSLLWSAVAALFGVDLEEIGINSSKSKPVLADNTAPRIEASKSRGLSQTLSTLESHYQQILERIDDRLDFEFVGYERDDPKVKSDQRKADLESIKTIDELRIEADMKPFNEDWSGMPLHPQAVAIYQAGKQAEMQQTMMGAGGQAPGQGGPGMDNDYRNLMMGDDEEVPGGQDDDGEDQQDTGSEPQEEAPRAEKSIATADVVEIII